MKAKQLSVFLENKSGRLTEVTEVLGADGINLSAMSIADNSDFGILRCIVSEPDKAYQVLKEAHFAVKITDVIGFTCPNTSGSLAKVLKHLSEKGVFIEYMYSFANGDVAHVIIRPTDLESCDRLLAEIEVDLLAASDLYKLYDCVQPRPESCDTVAAYAVCHEVIVTSKKTLPKIWRFQGFIVPLHALKKRRKETIR